MTAALSLHGASYRYPGSSRDSLHEVSLDLEPGGRTALLGPSGSGLSTLCLVLGGLAPRVIGGELRGQLLLAGIDVRDEPMHRLCGSVALGLSQASAQLSLVAETVYEEVAFGPANLGLPRGEVMDRTERALEQLAIPELAGRDPRRLSGGQQQLVAIAGLLAMQPGVLVLDDPLAHLDGRATEHVLAALAALAADGTAVVIAAHRADRAVLGSQRVVVMAEGRVAHQGEMAEVLADPAGWAHGVAEPGAWLLGSVSRVASDASPARRAAHPVDLELQGLRYAYPDGTVALDGVDLVIPGGQGVGLVGPNGSGKTTLARHLDGLLRPSGGRLLINGQDAAGLRVAELAASVALGFQDPDRQVFARRVSDEVAFGPRQLGFDAGRLAEAVAAALEMSGLSDAPALHPHDLGEAGRKLLAIASLLAMETAVLVLDEPTVGLDDVGIRRLQRIVQQLRAEGRTVIAISHDAHFVAESFERVVVMEAGRIIRDGSPADVFGEGTRAPCH